MSDKKSEKLSFNSKRLQQVFDEVSDGISDFEKKRDRISEDIKKLEDFLQAKHVSIAVGCDPIKAVGGWGESLSWEEDSTSGKFRIIYEKIVYDPDGQMTLQEHKPLIEAKLETRVRLYSHLPYLLVKIRKAIDQDDVSDQIWKVVEDELKDIPF